VSDSDLEAAFLTLWKQLGGRLPVKREFKFYPRRKWRADFAWPDCMVLVECEGQGGRHQSYMGFENDAEKYNAATLLGYRVFRVTSRMLKLDPAGALEPIIALVNP